MNRTLAISVLCLGLAAFGPALAVKPPAPRAASLSTADRALADKAAAYLAGLKTAQAHFSQTDPRGATTTGTFSLQRPGKARFAYDAPTDLTVVADGVNVNVSDGRLKTFDQYPLARTPLSLLLAPDVHFDGKVLISGVARGPSSFSVTLKDARKQAEGQLTLTFSAAPMALTGWTVVDGQGLRTTVKLDGLKTGISLDQKLFEAHNSEKKPFKIKA